ncbi:hypothetical protein B4077_4582 [Bacillus cereus]|uniref:Uncharacterized protein n=1 Tax=Bacillus cereus TaxID=1396 RepID=A0A0G8EK45_BACCE|nr:hypothetical protein B4077_4582 [Bacillus cereus]
MNLKGISDFEREGMFQEEMLKVTVLEHDEVFRIGIFVIYK